VKSHFSKLIIASALAGVGFATHAQYPERPIKLIVPFAAGTSTDAIAREVANTLSIIVKQPVIVDNRTGAEGNIGSKAVANSEPDGYTALVTSSSSAVLDGLMRKTPMFDPLKEVTPVCGIFSTGLVMYISSSLPHKSLAEFISVAKAQPGKFTYGYASASGRLGAELLQQIAGIKLRGIPYRATVAGLTAIGSGEIDMMLNDPGGAMSLYQAGKIRPLVVTTPTRISVLPDVPTGAEAGLKGFEMVPWWAMFLPAKTPNAVTDNMRQALTKSLASPAMVAARNKMGMNEFPLCGDALAKFQASEISRWQQVIEKAQIPLE